MKKVLALFIIVSLVVVSTAVGLHYSWVGRKQNETFYVGVTYCGNSTQEAMLLIDKVKDYSNLFVLQSGLLQEFPDQITEICDYAVSSGMYFMVYFGLAHTTYMTPWLETTTGRWGDRFLGVYYCDELGGKMLDSDAFFWDAATQSSLIKQMDGHISVHKSDENATVSYWLNGKIELVISETYWLSNNPDEFDLSLLVHNYTNIEYYPNGTTIVKVGDFGNFTIVEDYDLPYAYEELWNMRPFQTYDETAERFIDRHHSNLAHFTKAGTNVTAITSDYVFYWFNYKAGYDVVLAQLGWNHTLAQDIALVRGAAHLQNKEWGAIVTWKYNNPPYLDSGEAIYEQMRMAYEAGATYIVVFNYAENMDGPYGTLKEEHFQALERFWNQVVQSPFVEKGSIKAKAALVLPENYGWGMRHSEDNIWGIWPADEKTPQIWQLSRSLLEQYGLNLDIIYEDAEFPAEDNYSKIIYWNQTK